jgi:hypothetical protein
VQDQKTFWKDLEASEELKKLCESSISSLSSIRSRRFWKAQRPQRTSKNLSCFLKPSENLQNCLTCQLKLQKLLKSPIPTTQSIQNPKKFPFD